MATLRATASATLGSIQTAMDTTTKTINTVAIGIDMAHSWAQKEQQKQAANSKHDVRIIEHEALAQAAQRLSDVNLELSKYANKSNEHKQALANALAFLQDPNAKLELKI